MRRHLALTILILAVAAQGIFFALYLVPWEDESGYLFLSDLAIRGEIRLFQDEMLGERLPLPFYVLGLSQFPSGPSLLAARLASLALGLAALGLVYAVGARIGGPLSGTLSACFLASHAMVVGYYATATYHALCSLIVAAGLWVLWVKGSRVGAMAIFSLLSLTRANMAVMVPPVLALLWWQEPQPARRWLLAAVAALPPLSFLLWSPEHWKILAYVPVLDRLVRPLGYESLFHLGGAALTQDAGWRQGLEWFLRRNLFWCTAGAALTAVWLWARGWGAGRLRWPSGPVAFLGGLLVWMLAWQVLILRHYPKSVTAWSVSFAPLAALLLGYAAARILESLVILGWVRGWVIGGLLAVFLLSPTFSTHANMPRPLPEGATTVAGVNAAAKQIRAVVPPGSRVFLVGMSLPVYLAGSRPYLQQIIHSWTLVPHGDLAVLRRSGLWGREDIERWLGREAPYALVQSGRLELYRGLPGYRELAELMEAHLAARFVPVAEIAMGPSGAYRLYVRRGGPGGGG
ncbi:MAG TPA: hypothetical protein VFO18_03520 [Methylomirabilota bacterium]|nr:hypothetical protein [Methylomirabilota bacterium]